MTDIAEYYLKGVEGFDALFHLLLEKVTEEVEDQGIVDEARINSAKSIIGSKLYELTKISALTTEKDRKILEQMKKHAFVSL